MFKKLLLLTILVGISLMAFTKELKPVKGNKGVLKGFVFDSNVSQPLEYATITIISKKDSKLVSGTITDETGFFKMKGVDFGKYQIDIKFIGYKTKTIESVAIKPDSRVVDLGKINLEASAETLNETVIIADRPTMTYKIDKKIINVSQQHTSASGTAVEILENIPSITVDIDDNVSLRGSQSFTVLIDGKPSLLNPSDALNQMPSSSIENIEIITNPSAKFEPDGAVGIINILLKKNKQQGTTGVVNTSYGSNNSFGGDFLMSFRKEKLNFYLGADYNKRVKEHTAKTENITTKNDTSYYVFSDGTFGRDKISSGIRGGIDLNLNALNSLSLGVRLGERSKDKFPDYDFREWTTTEAGTSPIDYYKNGGKPTRSGQYYSVDLNYVRKFMKKGHTLMGQFIYNYEDEEDTDVTELKDLNEVLNIGQISKEFAPESEYIIKLDYTLPIGEKNKFEAGYQSKLSTSEGRNEMYLYNTSSKKYDFKSDFSHSIDSKRNIHSLYSLYSSEIGNFGYQLGLRGEYTDREISMVGEEKDFTLNRWDFFPTIHTSYSFENDIQVMASYSRRIQRPRSWYLEPFITWTDTYNARQGNPYLNPEYIDSYELSFQKKFGRNVFSIDAYYRVTNDKIERVRGLYEDYDKAYLNTVANVGKDYSFGTEIMFSFDISRWWHLDLMANLYDYKIEGELNGLDFSEDTFTWNARFNNTIKLSKSTRLQVNGIYNGPSVTAQGTIDGFLMANLALKQDLIKNKMSATFQLRDMLNTAGHKFTSEGFGFYSYAEKSPYAPMFSIKLNYRINNYKPDKKHKVVANEL